MCAVMTIPFKEEADETNSLCLQLRSSRNTSAEHAATKSSRPVQIVYEAVKVTCCRF